MQIEITVEEGPVDEGIGNRRDTGFELGVETAVAECIVARPVATDLGVVTSMRVSPIVMGGSGE